MPPTSPSRITSELLNAPLTGIPVPKITSTGPAPTDKLTTIDPTPSEPATADPTIFEPIAASVGSKKAKKLATKEPTSYTPSMRVTCADKWIVAESSMTCLHELKCTFHYKQLQR